MKYFTILLALFLVIFNPLTLLSHCGHCEGEQGKKAVCTEESCGKEPGGKTSVEPAKINVQALKSLIESKVPVIILDARTGKSDDGERITGAKSLSPEAKTEEISKVIPAKDALVVTYCAGLKCPASHKLYEHLKSKGYKNLMEFPEGIEGWKGAGQPVEKGKK